jgi:hypothetical protein
MSDEERARILRMVSEGKLSPEEAADLLEAIQTPPAPEFGPGGPMPPESPMPPEMSGLYVHGRHRRRGRCLVIHVREGNENKVNLRIPISLTKAAGKFIPRQATNYLAKYEINLTDFVEDLAEAEGGTILEIKEGDNKVLIAVE